MSTEPNQRVLTIIIKRDFFDQIADGSKTEEYREASDHWGQRLLTPEGKIREYDVVEFINGYAKNAPRLLVEWKGTELVIYDDAPEDSENPDDYEFVISLGKVLKRINC